MDRKQVGFTLVELMVVVSVIAVLAMIAYPTYQGAMAKQRRASAKELMTRVAQLEARYFTETNTYSTSLTALGLPSDPMPSDSKGHTISIAALGDIKTGYQISATPIIADATCGTLKLTSTNQRSATGTTPARCW